ncbi:hypothetical protein [Curtobacterium sp. PhB78]|uniref:hypothetical protein n=1 Tax=Curtobacterium sp. PhB78 TaxID=2485102 RepID=UPI000F4ADB16|nr:hypothetical protein [Curtobacterium sp. PhB78]ROS33748.1 hypothetical protein EDF53_3247 [Curtobacterium sp. PhB78]
MSTMHVEQGTLEPSYRRLLRWYPRRWRRQNEDALIGTLLDVAESEGRNRPRRSEVVDLAVNGIGTRVAAVLPATARDQAASFALGTGLAWSLVYFIVQDWMPWNPKAHNYALNPMGPFNSPGVIVTALWVLAGVFVLFGRHLPARLSALASSVVALVLLAVQAASSPEYVVVYPSPDRVTFVLLVGLGLIAAVGTPRRHWTTVLTAGGWGLALSAGLLLMHGRDMTSIPLAAGLPSWYDFFNRYLWSGGLLTTGVVWILVSALLATAVVSRWRGHRANAAALVVSVMPWVAATVTNSMRFHAVGASSILINLVMAATWIALATAALTLHPKAFANGDARGTPNPA